MVIHYDLLLNNSSNPKPTILEECHYLQVLLCIMQEEDTLILYNCFCSLS